MVYGHRMLWVKKLFASAAFLHCYLSESRPVDQLLAIKAEFGEHCLVELKYIRSRWLRERWGQSGDGVIFAPLIGMVNGREDLDDLLAFCDDIGVTYQNPTPSSSTSRGCSPIRGCCTASSARWIPRGC